MQRKSFRQTNTGNLDSYYAYTYYFRGGHSVGSTVNTEVSGSVW